MHYTLAKFITLDFLFLAVHTFRPLRRFVHYGLLFVHVSFLFVCSIELHAILNNCYCNLLKVHFDNLSYFPGFSRVSADNFAFRLADC